MKLKETGSNFKGLLTICKNGGPIEHTLFLFGNITIVHILVLRVFNRKAR